MADTLINPLSDSDHVGVSTSSITYGYVLKTEVDQKKIKEAFERVVDKWRLLAGRVEWNAETGRHQIRVPMPGKPLPSDYPLVTFTSATHPDVSLNPERLDASSACVLSRPSFKYFRHPNTPNAIGAWASQNLPIISIHVSTLQDCTGVGIVFPHGVFDGFGMGLVIHALDAEMNGKEWEVPAVREVNLLTGAFKELREAPPLVDRPYWTERLSELFTPMSVSGLGRFVASMAYETFWHKVEDRGLFLGADIVKKITDDVKQQVVDEGKGWVSTGDVLLAWLYKAAYVDESPTSTNTLSICGAMSSRSSLSDPGFKTYPHNAQLYYVAPTIPVNEVAKMSLADFAVLHRAAVKDCHNVAYTQAYVKFLPTMGQNAIPLRQMGVDSWWSSNQALGGPDKIDFGSEPLAMWHRSSPLMPDHTVVINQFKGGYMFDVGMRRSRWASIEKELERLKGNGESPRVV